MVFAVQDATEMTHIIGRPLEFLMPEEVAGPFCLLLTVSPPSTYRQDFFGTLPKIMFFLGTFCKGVPRAYFVVDMNFVTHTIAFGG